jgi:hypothetical protein
MAETVESLLAAIELAELHATRLYDRYTRLQHRLRRSYKHGSQSATRAFKEYVRVVDQIAALRKELSDLSKPNIGVS